MLVMDNFRNWKCLPNTSLWCKPATCYMVWVACHH